jgi:hypothetical protein
MSLTPLSLARAVATTPDNFGDKCAHCEKLDVRAGTRHFTPPLGPPSLGHWLLNRAAGRFGE